MTPVAEEREVCDVTALTTQQLRAPDVRRRVGHRARPQELQPQPLPVRLRRQTHGAHSVPSHGQPQLLRYIG